MKPLVLFLERYKNLRPADEELINIIIATIKSSLDYDLPTTAVKYQNGRIYITTSPLIRGEILMKKDKILEQVNTLASGNKITEIH